MKHIKYPEEWFSKHMLLNGLIYKPFSRVKLIAYRGESEYSGSGMAMYGVGIYSTTKYSYAKKFGKVRKVEVDEIPLFPIRFKTSLDFQQWEYDLMKKLDVSRDKFEEMGGVVKVVNDLGFDGVTIGTVSDMILVKYPENVEETKK